MDGDDIARLAYLGLLGAFIAGSLFLRGREGMGRNLQALAIWVLIFLGVIAAYGLWNDIRGEVLPRQAVLADGAIEVPMAPDGHYHLTLEVNGTPVRFVVDTGATDIVLSQRDAARVGLDPDNLAYVGSAFTANGVVEIAPVELAEVRLGPLVDRDIRAVVNAGALDGSLLGMGYLSLFDRIEIENGTLLLSR